PSGPPAPRPPSRRTRRGSRTSPGLSTRRAPARRPSAPPRPADIDATVVSRRRVQRPILGGWQTALGRSGERYEAREADGWVERRVGTRPSSIVATPRACPACLDDGAAGNDL